MPTPAENLIADGYPAPAVEEAVALLGADYGPDLEAVVRESLDLAGQGPAPSTSTTVHATVPVQWADGAHPLGATPDSWIDVVVSHPAGLGWGAIDTAARLALNEHAGRDGWMTTYFGDEPAWASYRRQYATADGPASVLLVDASEALSGPGSP